MVHGADGGRGRPKAWGQRRLTPPLWTSDFQGAGVGCCGQSVRGHRFSSHEATSPRGMCFCHWRRYFCRAGRPGLVLGSSASLGALGVRGTRLNEEDGDTPAGHPVTGKHGSAQPYDLRPPHPAGRSSETQGGPQSAAVAVAGRGGGAGTPRPWSWQSCAHARPPPGSCGRAHGHPHPHRHRHLLFYRASVKATRDGARRDASNCLVLFQCQTGAEMIGKQRESVCHEKS